MGQGPVKTEVVEGDIGQAELVGKTRLERGDLGGGCVWVGNLLTIDHNGDGSGRVEPIVSTSVRGCGRHDVRVDSVECARFEAVWAWQDMEGVSLDQRREGSAWGN